jgi:hypothetical protein
MIKTGTKKVLLAAMALLGGNLAAGVVTIVNTTHQTWTLRSLELIARDHRDSVWNATTIGPAETVLMDHKGKRLSYWIENKASRNERFGVSVALLEGNTGATATSALEAWGHQDQYLLAQGSSPSELVLKPRSLGAAESKTESAENASWRSSDESKVPAPAPGSTSSSSSSSSSSTPDGSTASEPIISLSPLPAEPTMLDEAAMVDPALEDNMQFIKMNRRHAAVDLIDSHVKVEEGMGPRAKPTDLSPATLRVASPARALGLLNRCLEDLKQLEQHLANATPGAFSAADLKGVKEERLTVEKLIKMAKERKIELSAMAAKGDRK